jgi:hypothetical protein
VKYRMEDVRRENEFMAERTPIRFVLNASPHPALRYPASRSLGPSATLEVLSWQSSRHEPAAPKLFQAFSSRQP